MAGGAVIPTPLSADNPRVRLVRRLARSRRERTESGQFVIEGPGLVADAAAADLSLDFVLVPPGGASSVVDAAPVFEIPEHTFASITTTTSPQPALAVARRPDREVQFGSGLVLALDGVADPGNAGTLLRAAEAAGAVGVVLLAGSVDAFGPKAVRASAGSVFRVPVEYLTPGEFAQRVAEAGVSVWGAAANADVSLDDADLGGATVLVLGNESHGIGDGLSVDRWLSIPMAGGTESLNVAMAGTVVMFEAFRQRRNGRDSGPTIA